MLRIECPCSDMILICACIRTLVLSLAINWILLQLAKVASFVASLRRRRGPPEMGWVRSVKSVIEAEHVGVEGNRFIDIANDVSDIDLAHDFFTSKKMILTV